MAELHNHPHSYSQQPMGPMGGGKAPDFNDPKVVYDLMVKDLAKSGLKVEHMAARIMDYAEKQAVNVPLSRAGYVIPYFDMDGLPVPFYRTKLFNAQVRYLQVANQPNHIYFPLGFKELVQEQLKRTAGKEEQRYIVLTEGEKKAACAVRHGIPCCAVAGVDSWRNRVMRLPQGTQLRQAPDGSVLAKVPQGSETTNKDSPYAEGFHGLVRFCIMHKINLVLCFDSDIEPITHRTGMPTKVKEAAARLGFELRYLGMPLNHIRQLELTANQKDIAFSSVKMTKLGLDDFLMNPNLGLAAFGELLKETLLKTNAFPRHPNIKAYINKRLSRARLSRIELANIATAIICDLDVHGRRLYSPDMDDLFYFSSQAKELLKVSFRLEASFGKTPFGVYLYRHYGLTLNDSRLIQVLGSLYAAEEPVAKVHPERVLVVKKNAVYYQISDSRMLKIGPDKFTFLDNGSEDILFEAGVVQPLDEAVLLSALKDDTAPLQNNWYTVLKETRIAPSPNDNNRRLLALLYYISPWLYRWNGTQLPVEMMIGEAGSGKSTLYALRLAILTGEPKLRNLPRDIKDWTASVANTGGLHVTDNVHMVQSAFKQLLSDELCRVVTAETPIIEARKLYEDSVQITVPVKTVFAITAIKQPFTNVDIVQRSIITELQKGTDEVFYDADWQARQLRRFNGREGWISHHAKVLQRLMQTMRKHWRRDFKAQYRLINVEQLLVLTARLFDWDSDWIGPFLASSIDKKVSETDWALEGLMLFASEWIAQHGSNSTKYFTAKDIAMWAESEEDFQGCSVLTNSRSLGKYLASHANQVSRSAGIVAVGTRANATCYTAVARVGQHST